MWRREMEWILSVSDHIVELTPSTQTYQDGKKFEVWPCKVIAPKYKELSEKYQDMVFLKLDCNQDNKRYVRVRGAEDNIVGFRVLYETQR
ncbi:PREDICTED: thioredoxin F-type, chloroplastic-like [Camelina sativa]|nr:PREDICTED: thioredoxin F-type, chloroplastic-like [Camelina sativa]